MTDRKTTLALILLLPLFAAGPRAQDPAPSAAAAAERLQALLHELGSLDAKAWAARQAALEQQCKAIDLRAAELRAQAAKLQEQAAAADAEGKAVRTEMARLQELQKLLQGSKPTKVETPPAPQPPTAPPAKVEAPPVKTEAPASPPPAAPPVVPLDPPAAATAVASPATAAATPLVTWHEVERIFQDHCSACHDPSDKKGGLDVTTFAGITKGGGSGRTLVPGEPDQSRLWLLVAQKERPFMPKGEDPLAQEQQRLLRSWIEQGACEDEAAARAFLQAKATAATNLAAVPNAVDVAGALPEDLPPQPLHVPVRPGPIKSLARSATAALLAMPGLRQVLLFDADLEPLGVLPCDLPHLETCTFAPDGSVLAVGGGEPGRSGVVALFDVRTGKALGRFGAERDVPLAVAVHGPRGLVALGGAGKRVSVLRIADGSEVFTGLHDDFVLALSFSPDGALLAAADRSGVVKLWETDGGRLGETLTGHRGAVHALAFARDGRMLVTAGADGTVRAWDAGAGKETWMRAAHAGEAFAVALGEGGMVASGGSDGRIKLHSRAGKELATSPVIGDWLYAVAFGSGKDVVFAGDWQGRVYRFDVKSKSKQMAVTVPLSAAQ